MASSTPYPRIALGQAAWPRYRVAVVNGLPAQPGPNARCVDDLLTRLEERCAEYWRRTIPVTILKSDRHRQCGGTRARRDRLPEAERGDCRSEQLPQRIRTLQTRGARAIRRASARQPVSAVADFECPRQVSRNPASRCLGGAGNRIQSSLFQQAGRRAIVPLLIVARNPDQPQSGFLVIGVGGIVRRAVAHNASALGAVRVLVRVGSCCEFLAIPECAERADTDHHRRLPDCKRSGQIFAGPGAQVVG